MIPRFRQIQGQNFTCLKKLAAFLELSDEQRARLWENPSFQLNVPLRLAQKMVKKTLDDPIVRQFVPLRDEQDSSPSFTADPIRDLDFCRTPRLLQKYHGRVLLLASGACAMHCRFCFRQHFPYDSAPTFAEELQKIQNDASIEEFILSGGDPLSLSNESLRRLFHTFEQIPHVRRIRLHTRFPIGIPERIDSELLELLQASSKQIWLVLHVNHPHELDTDIWAALRSIQRLGIPILSQSVLLRGVNDDEKILLSLYKTLINGGIHPYYLHLLDRVAGSAHFDVSDARGRELIAYIQEHISGYGVPHLVREVAGEPSKTHI